MKKRKKDEREDVAGASNELEKICRDREACDRSIYGANITAVGEEVDAIQRALDAEQAAADEAMRKAETERTTTLSLADFPPVVPEAENPEIIIKGRWLERGGSAWIVSTAGTGKSVLALQIALCWSMGLPCAGLKPNVVRGRKPPVVWIFQSEDSPTRVSIDREDITAELSERHPGVDWAEAARRVKFPGMKVHFRGKVGADWIEELREELASAADRGELPDVIIVNPFLAYVGGPITDGEYVTPFLRGGEINRKPTEGLQALAECYGFGLVVFHHTPKPPTEKEVEAWLRATFPEYQGAGSSDITNWGRSFVTMMRLPKLDGVVCLTAGKNGNDLGWEIVAGAPRRFLAFSDEIGCTGKRRHAWRDLEAEEKAEALTFYGGTGAAGAAANPREDAATLAAWLRSTPATARDINANGHKQTGLSRQRVRAAFAVLRAAPWEFGLAAVTPTGMKLTIYGPPEQADALAETWAKNYANARGEAGGIGSKSDPKTGAKNQPAESNVAECCRMLPNVAAVPGPLLPPGYKPPPLRGGLYAATLSSAPENEGGMLPNVADGQKRESEEYFDDIVI